jgi:hypothetical protein
MPLCSNGCGKDFSEYDGWWIRHTTPDTDKDGRDIEFESGLCSIDCTIEFAWKIREKQPKLSKSRRV